MADHTQRTPRRLLRLQGVHIAPASRHKPPRFLRLPDHHRRISELGFRPTPILSPPVVPHDHQAVPHVVGERKALWRARMQSSSPRADELVRLFRLLHLPDQMAPTRLPEVHLLRRARSSTTTPRLTLTW